MSHPSLRPVAGPNSTTSSTTSSTGALVPVTVTADQIEPGDRMHRNGKTRYVRSHAFASGRIVWRIQTTGTRSPSLVAYAADEQVTVWLRPAR